MVRRSPAESYIRYLTLPIHELSDKAVFTRLVHEQLDPVREPYIRALRKELRPPTPFRPKDRGHHPSQVFLMKAGLRDFFEDTQPMRQAWAILRNARAKEVVESMALTGAPAMATALFLTRNYRLPTSEAGIQKYCRHFWNLQNVDATETRIMLEQRNSRTVEGETDEEKKARKWAGRRDSRTLAAEMPHSVVSAQIAQLRMGFSLNHRELQSMVETTRALAIARSMEACVIAGEFDSKRALEFAGVAEKMSGVLEVLVRPEEELRKELKKIALKTESPESVPMLHQLTQGRHTIDVLPEASKDNEDAAELDELP